MISNIIKRKREKIKVFFHIFYQNPPPVLTNSPFSIKIDTGIPQGISERNRV